MIKKLCSIALLALSFNISSYAQSFTAQHDTVAFMSSEFYSAIDGISVPGTSPVNIQWRVVASNFPADWKEKTGICDALNCYSSTPVFAGTNYTCLYNPGMGDFHLQIDQATTTSTGTYYTKVKLNNAANPNDTVNVVFVASKFPTAVNDVNGANSVTMYPNPAVNELHVKYNALAGVRNVEIYSIIGKKMSVNKVTGIDNTVVNLENIPTGIYFLRLTNTSGDIVATKRFTKQ